MTDGTISYGIRIQSRIFLLVRSLVTMVCEQIYGGRETTGIDYSVLRLPRRSLFASVFQPDELMSSAKLILGIM